MHHPEACRANAARHGIPIRFFAGSGGKLTPHVLRHFCASQMYLNGVDLISIQEMLGHSWVATTMRYVHVHRTRIEQAWIAGQERAAKRLEGLFR